MEAPTNEAAGPAEDTAKTKPPQRQCNSCGKSLDNLQVCGRCKSAYYCSKDCQTKDWKNHKKPCKEKAAAHNNKPPASSTSGGAASRAKPEPPKGLSQHIDKPFTRLENKTFLHDLPEIDVYRLLIDSFRMRQEDNYKFLGDADIDSLYDGSANSLRPFRKFIARAERKTGILPPWWNASKRDACIALGMKGGDEWADLKCCVEKSDIMEHYEDSRMPMKLRMLAEFICGIASWTQAQGGGGPMRRILMEQEASTGGGGGTIIIDSSPFVNSFLGGLRMNG